MSDESHDEGEGAGGGEEEDVPAPPQLATPEDLEAEAIAVQQAKRDIRQAHKKELIDKIKRVWRRRPDLKVDIKDSMGDQLNGYTVGDLEIVLENMELQISIAPELSPVEAGLLRSYALGVRAGLGVDITEDLLSDASIRADLREMGHGWLNHMPAWADVILRSSMMIAAHLAPSFSGPIKETLRRHTRPGETFVPSTRPGNDGVPAAPVPPTGERSQQGGQDLRPGGPPGALADPAVGVGEYMALLPHQ